MVCRHKPASAGGPLQEDAEWSGKGEPEDEMILGDLEMGDHAGQQEQGGADDDDNDMSDVAAILVGLQVRLACLASPATLRAMH